MAQVKQFIHRSISTFVETILYFSEFLVNCNTVLYLTSAPHFIPDTIFIFPPSSCSIYKMVIYILMTFCYYFYILINNDHNDDNNKYYNTVIIIIILQQL